MDQIGGQCVSFLMDHGDIMCEACLFLSKNGQTSQSAGVLSGVPQGSVLGVSVVF